MLAPRGGAGQGGPGGRGGLGQIDYEGIDARGVPIDRAKVARVIGLFRPYRRLAAAILGCVLVSAGLAILPPLIIKAIIDDVLPAGYLGRLALLVTAMVVVGVFAAGVGVVEQWLNLRVGQSVMYDLRNALFERVQQMPFSFFTTTRTGEIMSRIFSDVQAVQGVVTLSLVTIAQNLALVIATVAVMVAINWSLALVSLAALPLFILPVRRAGRIRARLVRETQDKMADATARMQESLGINGILLTKVFGRQPLESARFERTSAELKELQIRQMLAGRWFQMLVGLFAIVSPAIVFMYGGWQLKEGNLTLGGLIAFTALLAADLHAGVAARQRLDRHSRVAGAVRADLRVPRPRRSAP